MAADASAHRRPPRSTTAHSCGGSVTIHIRPKRSTAMPKPLLQNVSPQGMTIWPPSASALKYFCADAVSSAVSDRLKLAHRLRVLIAVAVGRHPLSRAHLHVRMHDLFFDAGARRVLRIGRRVLETHHERDFGAQMLAVIIERFFATPVEEYVRLTSIVASRNKDECPRCQTAKETAETAGVQTILGNGARAFVTLCRAEKTTRTITALHKKRVNQPIKRPASKYKRPRTASVRGRLIESHDGWRRVRRPAP